jgi:hypothetical protein
MKINRRRKRRTKTSSIRRSRVDRRRVKRRRNTTWEVLCPISKQLSIEGRWSISN